MTIQIYKIEDKSQLNFLHYLYIALFQYFHLMATELPLRMVSVDTDRLLKVFIRFPFKIYKDNPYWAPPLDWDEKKTLSQKNPAREFCDLHCILVYRGEEVVGRMALIINRRYNEEHNERMGRFGWVDFIDDYEVSKAMFDYGVAWHKERGMKELHGPLGFTDFDYQGMLSEGFDKMGTMSTIYNHAYYNDHVVRYGFEKKAVWVERQIRPTNNYAKFCPETAEPLIKVIQKRAKIRLANIKSKKEMIAYAPQVFGLINHMYKKLYGFTSLTQEQVDFYIKSYFPLADPDLIPITVNEQNEVVAFIIGFPSFTKALQKCRGRLFPFGFWYMFRALKKNDTLDLYLAAVHPDYLNKGLILPMIHQLMLACNRYGMTKVETNIVLEDNVEMSNVYNRKSEFFDVVVAKRRISYYLKIA